MMKPQFSKAGVWLFLAAVVWYVAGNFALESMNKNNLALAKSLHQTEHHFDIGKLESVVIRAQNNNVWTGGIKVVFDPNATQASINNENLRLSVNGKMLDGVLNISLENIETRQYRQTSEFTVLLPPTLKKVKFSGIDSVTLSGSLPASDAELNLEITDCRSTVNMGNLIVNHLKITSACQTKLKKHWNEEGFVLSDGVQINQLDVSMQFGMLKSVSYTHLTLPTIYSV